MPRRLRNDAMPSGRASDPKKRRRTLHHCKRATIFLKYPKYQFDLGITDRAGLVRASASVRLGRASASARLARASVGTHVI
eukprot:6207434-Pleurochrysis_carterae.AAC.1